MKSYNINEKCIYGYLAEYFWSVITWRTTFWFTWKDQTNLPKACFSYISSSEHCKPGSYICHTISKLVFHWASWLVACCCFCGCSAGEEAILPYLYILLIKWLDEVNDLYILLQIDCYFDCGLCKLEFRCNWRNWMGLGWCDLALQYRFLHPPWYLKILYSICYKWEGLGSCSWAKGMNIFLMLEWYHFYVFIIIIRVLSIGHIAGCFYQAEGFWKGTKGAEMGTCTKNPSWAWSTWHQDV